MREWLSNVPDLEFPGDRFALMSCATCGLIATDPYPSDDTICALYATGDSSDYEFPEAGFLANVKEWLARARIRAIARLAGIQPKAVLDYGTGAGRYAAAAARSFEGADVVGADFSPVPPLGSYFERATGNLRYCEYARLLEGDERFDLIFARHVLEHVGDPIATVRSWINMLSPTGVLYIEVPNTTSVTARFLKERWPLLYLPKHLSHFTRETFAKTLAAAEGDATIGSCEMPMMGNVLAIASGRSRFDPRFRLPGIVAHPVQIALETLGRQGTCLYALVRRPGASVER